MAHVFQCNVFQNNVFQGVCGVAPPVAPVGGFDPGFWTEEHRKIKEREERTEPERAGAPITALSAIPELILPDTAEIDEILELMAILDDHARLS